MSWKLEDAVRHAGFERAKGYLQALDLAIAHWPEDRKCRCDPALTGGACPTCGGDIHTGHGSTWDSFPSRGEGHEVPCPTPEFDIAASTCYSYCWLKQVHRTAAVNAEEDEEYANTIPY